MGVRTGRKKRKFCRKSKGNSGHCSPKKGKELIALAAVGTRGKSRTLENNLIRSNSTKSKKRNTNRMQNPNFSFKSKKLHQIHGGHCPSSLI
jgi:hypothetical protein